MFRRLKDYLRPRCGKGALLAFSGGVDSALLLAVLVSLRKEQDFPLAAVTMHSDLHTEEELDRVRHAAAEAQVELILLAFDPLKLPALQENPRNRCYLCKRHLFEEIRRIGREREIPFIAEGTNADDLQVYRPGRLALKELEICSPLAELGIRKAEIRAMAEALSLSSAGLPSTPCLATRFEYGTHLTPEKLHAAAEGEAFLRSLLPKEADIRLRVHGRSVRIEMDPAFFPVFLPYRNVAVSYLKKLGYHYITADLEGFRSGSMDEATERKNPDFL